MIQLSVIIPTYNRRHVLERTLPSLLAQDLAPEEYEIIVVMDGSNDGTAELLNNWKPKCAFRALQMAHCGPSAARNAGIQAAVGELILFLDDDLMGAPDLLRRHCEAHVHREPCVTHGPIYVSPESAETIPRYHFEIGYEMYFGSLFPGQELRYPADFFPSIALMSAVANSCIPRDVLLRCGGFDEQILSGEDLELGLRLWKMGLPFRYLADAPAFELYIKTSWEYLRWQIRTSASGDLQICRKHSEYRPCSLLSPLAETSLFRRWARGLLMRMPLSPVPLLAFPLLFERWFCRFSPMRKAGLHLLKIAERIARLRASLSAVGSGKALQSEFGHSCTALMYHHVGPFRPGVLREWTISPEQFESQIRWLARRGYAGIRPSDWLRWLREGTGLPEKPVMITFDDGYADTAEFALPILRKYGFAGVVFVVTDRIGKTNVWDESKGSGTLPLMTAEAIRYWAEQDIEFGAHSRSHADLTELSGEELTAEVTGSKRDLDALLGVPTCAFAYPYGKYNGIVRDEVRSCFDLGFCSDEGKNFLQSDPSLLRRVCIGPACSRLEFALGIRWGGIANLRAKIGLRTRLRRLFGFRSQRKSN